MLSKLNISPLYNEVTGITYFVITPENNLSINNNANRVVIFFIS